MAVITDSVTFPTGGTKFSFVCAKRTFCMTLSPYFDRFPENLICEEIIIKMGLPILDRKCETISINGFKTETVGLVKTTVQCLKNGVQNGTIYIKARVVRDFYKLFGSDGLCSEHLRKKLKPSEANKDTTAMFEETDDENKIKTEPTFDAKEKSTSPPSTPLSKTSSLSLSPSPVDAQSSTSLIRNITSPLINKTIFTPRDLLSPGSQCVRDWAIKRAAVATRRSTTSPQRSPPNPPLPPGFNPSYLKSRMSCSKSPTSPPEFSSPQYPATPAPIKVPYDLPLQINTAMMSPYSDNVSRLTATFGDTDILDNYGERSAYLQRLDPDGKLDLSKNGINFAYYKSRDLTSSPSMTHSAVYRSGHGRVSCRMACKDSKLFSHNCGHHSQWKMPLNFQYCGNDCKGGLCKCLRRHYSDFGYYG